MQDGTRYTFRPGQRAHVADEHADAIARGWYGQTGTIGGDTFTFGTRTTRVCRTCQPVRRWNAWSALCPRCGADTVLEGGQAE
jgi:Zn finger protein HypA/HybF involved in hydrogenase expression